MSNKNGPAWASFVRLFGEIARHHHRYEVFKDFVTMAALAYTTPSARTRNLKPSI